MLSYLADYSDYFGPLRLLKYITVRTALAAVTSLIIGFTIGYISYGTRVMNAAVLQVHKDLEEAAKMSGAPQWRQMWLARLG